MGQEEPDEGTEALSDGKLATDDASGDELLTEDLERRRDEKGKTSERDLIRVQPTRRSTMLAVRSLVSFYQERLDVFVDDALEPFRHLATPGATPESATASRSGEDQLALERFNAFVSATCTPT